MQDPYARCEAMCTHELALGVELADLLSGEDGPYHDGWYGWGNKAPKGIPLDARAWRGILPPGTL